ncbi:MAG: hypothetical protein AAGA75_16215 [Cyanobacteria bacterium P01_E01_bin.6]
MPSSTQTKPETFIPSSRQISFTRHLIGVLLNLTVLGLTEQYWQYVFIDSFMLLLLIAALIQVVLKLTMEVIHRLLVFFFTARSGFGILLGKAIVFFVIDVSAKVILLLGIHAVFGERVRFGGIGDGNLAFAVVVIIMLLTEQFFLRIHNRLN